MIKIIGGTSGTFQPH